MSGSSHSSPKSDGSAWRAFWAALGTYSLWLVLGMVVEVLILGPSLFAEGGKMTAPLYTLAVLALFAGHCLGSYAGGRQSVKRAGRVSIAWLILVIVGFFFVDLAPRSERAFAAGKADFVVPWWMDIVFYSCIILAISLLSRLGAKHELAKQWADPE